ncbi:nucleolar zinc-finger protein [Gurleya vavrai]
MQNYPNRVTESPLFSDDMCPECQSKGQSRIMKVNLKNEAPLYISSFTCTNCPFSHRQIFDGDVGDGTGIKINCEFNCHDDLNRMIRIQKYARVTFSKENHSYVYGCGESGITVVEEIIRRLVEDLGDTFDISTSTDSFSRLGEKSSSSASTSSFLSAVDKTDAKEQASFLKKMKVDPSFLMVVEDDSGLSRVAPVNALITDMNAEDLNTFNDERVKHDLYEVKIDEESAEDINLNEADNEKEE